MEESLVKYLAGLLDADGSLSFSFKHDRNRQGRYFVGLMLKLSSSIAVDKNEFVDSLPSLTKFGTVNYSGNNRQFKNWVVAKRADLEMLLPRVIKHMVIKARHWQWLLDTWRELRGGYGENSCNEKKRESLANDSKVSRNERVGPIKPKNHPTWAWLAGYLDGDGWYSYRKYNVNGYTQWTIHVGAVAHVNDVLALEFIEKAFGGAISDQGKTGNTKKWQRSLGYQNKSFALSFLPNLAKHSRLKRDKIEAIISHHLQRLSAPGVERRFCSVDGCETRVHGHGLCAKHYLQKRKQDVSDSLTGSLSG